MVNKEEITDDDVLKCQQVIYNFVTFEARHEPLSLPLSHRLKGTKKDDQYRLLWAEMETVLESAPNSRGHQKILQCLRDCRNNVTEHKEQSKTTTDSPMSPPGSSELTKTKSPFLSMSGNRSLLDLKATADQIQSTKRMDFSGRLCHPPGCVAKLYPNFRQDEGMVTTRGEEFK